MAPRHLGSVINAYREDIICDFDACFPLLMPFDMRRRFTQNAMLTGFLCLDGFSVVVSPRACLPFIFTRLD